RYYGAGYSHKAPSLLPHAPRRGARPLAVPHGALSRRQGRGGARELAVLRPALRPRYRGRHRAHARRASLARPSRLPHPADEGGAGPRGDRRALFEQLGGGQGGGPQRRARGPARVVGGGGAVSPRLHRALRPRRRALRRRARAPLMLDLLWIPFLACLVLTAIHVYLGLHVLAPGVIFVDLALAQVAALGVTVAFLAGHPIQSDAAYWYALAFAVGGATLFSLTRVRHARIPQEAIIGIVYVVAAALTVLVVDRAPQGAEHIKQLLVGSLLTVTPGELARVAVLYAVIGVGHALVRRPLRGDSLDPAIAAARGRAPRRGGFGLHVTP